MNRISCTKPGQHQHKISTFRTNYTYFHRSYVLTFWKIHSLIMFDRGSLFLFQWYLKGDFPQPIWMPHLTIGGLAGCGFRVSLVSLKLPPSHQNPTRPKPHDTDNGENTLQTERNKELSPGRSVTQRMPTLGSTVSCGRAWRHVRWRYLYNTSSSC